MELTEDACQVLTPCEMRNLRREGAGWTLDKLAAESGVSKTQLSQYENGKNGLTQAQVERIEGLLLGAARSRSQLISRLVASDDAVESMAS